MSDKKPAPAQGDRCAKCGHDFDGHIRVIEQTSIAHHLFAPAQPPASVNAGNGLGLVKDTLRGRIRKPPPSDALPSRESHVCNEGICVVCGRTVFRNGGASTGNTPSREERMSEEALKDLLRRLMISMLYTGKKHMADREEIQTQIIAHDVALRADLAREKERADEAEHEMTEVIDERDHWLNRLGKAEAERDTLAERVRVAREALEEYGQHTPLCRGQEVNSCDCGLTQALGGRGRE